MEILQTVLAYIGVALGGISLTAIITAIICGILKGAFNKAINKINVEKISERAVDKTVGRVKKVSFEQNIQPIVESELEKINEKSNEHIKKALEETNERYEKLITILEKLACYFDNSIGVPDSAKEELHSAIDMAKTQKVEPQIVKITEEEVKIELTEETKKETSKVQR